MKIEAIDMDSTIEVDYIPGLAMPALSTMKR
jgi:hypothetical protein